VSKLAQQILVEQLIKWNLIEGRLGRRRARSHRP